MTPEFLAAFLLWSLAANYAVLVVWFVAFVAAHDALYALHSRWFRVERATFDAIHYAGMAAYKIGILLLNLAPLVALHLAGGTA